MNRNSQAHSEPKNERQFAEKDKSQIKEIICNAIRKNGLQKGAEILTENFLKSVEKDNVERQEQEKKRKKRKAICIVVLAFVFLVILGTCFVEWWLGRGQNLNGIWGKILPYVTLLLESMPVLPTIWKIAKMPESTRFRKDDEGIAEAMLKWTKNFVHQFLKASGLHVSLFLMGVTVVSTLIAQCEPMKHLEVFCSGGMYALEHYDDNNNITDPTMLADGGLNKISASFEMKQYLAGADETMIKQLDKAEVTNEQKNMVLQLSMEDYSSIFTSWRNEQGGYGTQEQLNSAVLLTVQGWCGENRDNVFDREPLQGGAPQKDKNRISQASESEKPNDSFSDVEEKLDLREGIVKDYPKRSLMQLVANGYQSLALRLVWHEGVQSTIIYYYGQSILFDFECLKFADNTDKLIKERLTIIAQRYEDIAYVCPNFERAVEARSLAAAFRYAADQY